MPHATERTCRRIGFSLIEVLVVIGVLGLLLAILLPALASARNASMKTSELSSLRQIGVAWQNYATYNNDRALPGFLPEDVQTAWRVRLTLQADDSTIPAVDAAPYTWRLLPFIEHRHELVYDYRNQVDINPVAERSNIAQRPAFGYNAHYIGGWYEGLNPLGGPIVRFEDDNVVARGVTQIQRSSEIIIFASSTSLAAGNRISRIDESVFGSHHVLPRILAGTTQWTAAGDTITAATDTNPPAARYTNQAAVVHADGHTGTESPVGMADQRRWIPNATTADFTHGP